VLSGELFADQIDLHGEIVKKLERQQVMIFGIAMAIVAGFGLFQYYPMARKADSIRKTIEQQQVVSDETDQLIQQMSRLRNQVESLKPLVTEFERKLPRSRQFASLWQQISDAMNQHRLTDQVVQRDAESDDSRFGSLRIRLQCTGTYQQLFGFFQSLQSLDRFVRIENFQISNDNEYSGRVKLEAVARVYYQIASSETP
jgi:Tfp pilus assembly protein PilO